MPITKSTLSKQNTNHKRNVKSALKCRIWDVCGLYCSHHCFVWYNVGYGTVHCSKLAWVEGGRDDTNLAEDRANIPLGEPPTLTYSLPPVQYSGISLQYVNKAWQTSLYSLFMVPCDRRLHKSKHFIKNNKLSGKFIKNRTASIYEEMSFPERNEKKKHCTDCHCWTSPSYIFST